MAVIDKFDCISKLKLSFLFCCIVAGLRGSMVRRVNRVHLSRMDFISAKQISRISVVDRFSTSQNSHQTSGQSESGKLSERNHHFESHLKSTEPLDEWNPGPRRILNVTVNNEAKKEEVIFIKNWRLSMILLVVGYEHILQTICGNHFQTQIKSIITTNIM